MAWRRFMFLAVNLTPLVLAGAITSGSISSNRGGSMINTYNISLSGASDLGNPFSITIGRPGGVSPNLGNDRCRLVGPTLPGDCTWEFSSIDIVSVKDGFSAFAGQSILLDGVTYDLSPGTP